MANAENIAVYDYFNAYEPIAFGENGQGEFTLTLGDDMRSVSAAFVIENTGATQKTFTFIIEKIEV